MMAPDMLVIGRRGQLAGALARTAPGAGLSVTCLGRPVIDLAAPETIAEALDRTAPGVVVNAAAYTAVDRAEMEPERARAVNAWAPGIVAMWCRECGVPLIHVSTDYVFDGIGRVPYREDDPTGPLGVYGETKLAGEIVVRDGLERHVILRTAWLHSADGANFVTTMLRLARERRVLRVVDDQHGAPTYVDDLAAAIVRLAGMILDGGPGWSSSREGVWGTYHLTNRGSASRYEFARAIFDIASRSGAARPTVVPIASAEHGASARRPAWSVLDTGLAERRLGLVLPHWRDGLERCLDRVAAEAA